MADIHIKSCVMTPQRYCISRKKTYSAERIIPIPILNATRHVIGYRRQMNFQVNVTPSIAANPKNSSSVKPKLIRDDMFCESRNRYFGTLTFVKMGALFTSAFMLRLVESVKYENTSWPENR